MQVQIKKNILELIMNGKLIPKIDKITIFIFIIDLKEYISNNLPHIT